MNERFLKYNDCDNKSETTKKPQFLYMLLSMILALITLTTASYAWFATNKSVVAQDMRIAAKLYGGYEIASKSDYGVYSKDDFISLLNLIKPKGSELDYNGEKLYVTSNSEPHIEWLVDSNSHFNNIDEAAPLQPGSCGCVTFYIVPPNDAAEDTRQELSIKLTIDGFAVNDGGIISKSDEDEPANELLKGHILFFRELNNNQYRGLIENGTFTIDAVGNKIQEVKLYWIWPMLYGNLIKTSDKLSTICEENGNDYNLLVADMESHNDRYFLFKKDKEVYTTTDLDDGYNNADEEIGERIRYILLSLHIN